MRTQAIVAATAAYVLGNALSARALVAFTQPITGGTYDVGTPLIVAWTYSDANYTNPTTLTGTLYLEKGKDPNSMEIQDVVEQSLTNAVVKKGTYTWTIPTKYASDRGYALRMVVENQIAHTPMFTLNNPAQPLPAAPPASSAPPGAAPTTTSGTTKPNPATPNTSGTAGTFASMSTATLVFAGVLGIVVGNAIPRFL